MPPKPRISKEMILSAVLEITRKTGFLEVNARSIAEYLHCSTRPIFTCYKNMDELKKDFLLFAYEFYRQYVEDYRARGLASDDLVLPLSYIEFAREETSLFQLLFVDDMDLSMTEEADFYKEIDNEKRAEAFSASIGIEPGRAKAIFLDLFLYSHGMAVLTAAGKIALDREQVEKMLTHVLTALVKQEEPKM